MGGGSEGARRVGDHRIEALERAMDARPPREVELSDGAPTAAVALLVRPGAEGAELLLIRRAEREGDPWSGHMALPGGRAAPGDADAVATAARETREEVGIDVLEHGRLLGPLDVLGPMTGGATYITVAPFVFAVEPGVEPVPNHEVALALWVPLAELELPGAATEYLLELHDGTTVPFPAFGARGHVVWGMTYRILTGFLELYTQAADAERLHLFDR